MIDKKGAERRRYERHELEDRFFNASGHTRIGWLTDISKGAYPEYSNIEDYSLTENVIVDIFSAPKKVLKQLVYDSRVDRGKGLKTLKPGDGLVFGGSVAGPDCPA